MAALPERQAEAWAKNDQSATPLIREVLEDSFRKSYCYDLTARQNAFDLIGPHNYKELRPSLLRVARMGYPSEEDYRKTWDIVSIQRSLIALCDQRDPMAASLNALRMTSDYWIQGVAFRNLRQLESWSVTGEAIVILGKAQLDAKRQGTIKEILAFLAESPATTVEVCDSVRAITRKFSHCGPVESSECGDLLAHLSRLDQRFSCSNVGSAELR